MPQQHAEAAGVTANDPATPRQPGYATLWAFLLKGISSEWVWGSCWPTSCMQKALLLSVGALNRLAWSAADE